MNNSPSMYFKQKVIFHRTRYSHLNFELNPDKENDSIEKENDFLVVKRGLLSLNQLILQFLYGVLQMCSPSILLMGKMIHSTMTSGYNELRPRMLNLFHNVSFYRIFAMVHKVLAGSPADRDGRIQKGDRILSINGRSMKGVSHRESLAILKAPRPEVVLVVSRWRPDGYSDPQSAEDPLVLGLRNNLRPPRIPEQPPDTPTDSSASDKEEAGESGVARGPPLTVTLVKDGAGLGFSLEGGKDSPLGDQPLTIKKIFTGGCAEKSGQLFAGDELLSVNGTDVTSMSRIEAWGLMKRLADGKVVLVVRHKAAN